MITAAVFNVIAFIVLFALCTRLNRDHVVWGILGLVITPCGSIIAMLCYTLIVGD